jgi:hypothetical protein
MIAEMSLIRMCDERLDSSSEAILSRVSKLEDQIKLASFGTPIVVSRPEDTAAVQEPEKEKPIKKEKTEEQKSASAAKAEPSNSDKPKLRPLRCKMEVAEKLGQTDVPSSSFLKRAKMLEDSDGNIIIRLVGDFAVSMLTRPKIKEALLASLSSTLGRIVSDSSLKIEAITENEEKEFDLLDELIND